MIPKDINSYYRLHSKFYNVTRWAFLFGRYKVIDFLPDLPNDARILDLGCGTGMHLPVLRKKYPVAEVIGLDQSPDMLEQVDEPSTILRHEEYQRSSFEPNSLDLVLCSYSLSMMSENDEKLDHIMHHLKKTGMLLVVDFDSTPFKWFSRWMKKNHVSFRPNLFELLEKHFDVEYLITRNAWFGLYTYSTYLGSKK